MMTILLLLFLLTGLVLVSFTKIETAIFSAIAVTIFVVALYPSFTIGALNTGLSLVGLSLILGIALLRGIVSDLEPKTSPGTFAFVFFVAVTSIANSIGGDNERIMIMSVQGLMITLLTLTSRYFQPQQRNKLISVFAVLIVIQFIVTVGEQFLGTGALWPRVNGTDIIANRPNSFTDILVGRSLGTMSMMITLGAFCGFSILLFTQRFLDSKFKSKLWWLAMATLAGLVIFFSGTRSAVVSLMLALVIWLLTSLKSLISQLALLLGGTLAILAVLQIDIVALLGFSDFENTESFEHRFGVISSVTTILSEPTGLLFGRGGVGATDLLVNSLNGTEGLTSYDNMYVRELAVSGLVGFSLLVCFIFRTFFSRNTLTNILMVYLAAMGMSFDQFTWRITFVLFALTVAGVFIADKKQLEQIDKTDIPQGENEQKSLNETKDFLSKSTVTLVEPENRIFVKGKLFK